MKKSWIPSYGHLTIFLFSLVFTMLLESLRPHDILPVESQIVLFAVVLGLGFAVVDIVVLWFIAARFPRLLTRMLSILLGMSAAVTFADLYVGYGVFFTLLRTAIEVALDIVAYQYFAQRYTYENSPS